MSSLRMNSGPTYILLKPAKNVLVFEELSLAYCTQQLAGKSKIQRRGKDTVRFECFKVNVSCAVG